ncbi:uncharacterized protein LOC111828238 [Myotis lucifugus]|uniref:uncharacterized protein LOC111828238 n=1 Tax=Myotis lucifugus TaxID=59463 RepID=UPI000CCC4ADA|nr:uncharacterized protein LOC111828238 [Myotis lucifugus]
MPQTKAPTLRRVNLANSVVLWAHTYARVHNVSHCWVYTEIPPGSAGGFPWRIHPATTANWTWLADQDFGNASWDPVHQVTETLIQQDHGNTRPFIGYAVWNVWGWLLGEQIELRELADRCVEQQQCSKDHTVGWLPPDLCRNVATNVEVQKPWNGKHYNGTKLVDMIMPGYLWKVWLALPSRKLVRSIYLGKALHPWVNS